MTDEHTFETETQEASQRVLSSEHLATQEVDLNSEYYTFQLRNAPIYEKFTRERVRIAHGGEVVRTVLADGLVETSNIAHEGDDIITNPGGEEYIVPKDEFASKYLPVAGSENEFQAVGQVRAVRNMTGGNISIVAPWGEKMIGDTDCYILAHYDPNNPEEVSAERYVIGGDEFHSTYTASRDADKVGLDARLLVDTLK